MCEVLDLLLSQIGRVLSHSEVHWESSSCRWVHIGHQEEVEELVVVGLDDCLVHESTWTRVDVVAVLLLEEPGGNFGVHEHIEDLWVVVWSIRSDGVLDVANFLFEDLILEGWATDASSVHHDETWLLSIVLLGVDFEGLPDEVLEDLGPL